LTISIEEGEVVDGAIWRELMARGGGITRELISLRG
jgi:hypothetical protein